MSPADPHLAPRSVPLAAGANPPADLLVTGGRVFMPAAVDATGAAPSLSAVAIVGDRIAAIGDGRDLARWRGPRTDVIYAAGGLILPGFDDAHVHLRMGSVALGRLDLFGLTTLDSVQAAIRAYAASRPDVPWIVGRGWLYAAFPGGLPTREQLDAIVPDRPAYFECFDGHSGWANSRALEMAGIDESTLDPRDGRIVRDPAGRPTGALKERAAELVDRHVPEPSDEELVRLMRDGLTALSRSGITAAQDAWGRVEDLELLEQVRASDRDGRLPIRFRLGLEMLPGTGEEGFRAQLDRIEESTRGRWNDPWLRAGVLKSFMDGVVEARTAYLLEHYPGTETRGDARWADDEIAWAVGEAHGRGWQVKLHAIGTAAVRQALDAYAALGKGQAAQRRHRIEHIETLDADDLPRFAALGVVASMQPFHAVPELDQMGIWAGNLAPEVAASGWRIRSLLRSGAKLAFGSDWPVVPFDPLLELHAATNRQTTDHRPEGGFIADEAIGVADALEAATRGSAYAEHADEERGTLEVGKLADLVVLDRDLLAEGPTAVLGARVTATVIGGRIVHRT